MVLRGRLISLSLTYFLKRRLNGIAQKVITENGGYGVYSTVCHPLRIAANTRLWRKYGTRR